MAHLHCLYRSYIPHHEQKLSGEKGCFLFYSLYSHPLGKQRQELKQRPQKVMLSGVLQSSGSTTCLKEPKQQWAEPFYNNYYQSRKCPTGMSTGQCHSTVFPSSLMTQVDIRLTMSLLVLAKSQRGGGKTVSSTLKKMVFSVTQGFSYWKSLTALSLPIILF